MDSTPVNIWNKCLVFIEDNINKESFETWFKPIKPIKIKNSTLTVEVPSKFFFEWIEENYLDLIKSAIKKELGNEGKLLYNVVMNHSEQSSYSVQIPSSNSQIKQNPSRNIPIQALEKKFKNPFIIPGLKKIQINSQLNSNYSFDNFIEGSCNRLARSAGFAVAQKPAGTSFNPLLIYGGVGLGKTHLAHAIGIKIKELHPTKTILYVSAEKFTQQFIESIRNNTRNDFSHFYQMVDVLIIDDVQFFSSKEKTQDIFFHIFNHLHQNNKQIILTSDRAPVDLTGMEQRLLSRFKWGLSADLQQPDLETRIAILKKKIYLDGIDIGDDVIEYLAYSISTNIRELEGALISLLAQASLNKKEITISLAREMIDRFVKNTTREVSIDYIQKVICDYFDLSIDTLKSKTRKRNIVQARQLAMYFSKQLTKSSLANIGARCGGKDHATVLHACKTVNNLVDTDKDFRNYVQELEKKFTLP